MQTASKTNQKQGWVSRTASAVSQKIKSGLGTMSQTPLQAQIELTFLAFGAFYAMPEPIFRRYDLLQEAAEKKGKNIK